MALLLQTQVPFTPGTGTGDNAGAWLWGAMAVGALGLVAAWMLARKVIAADSGTADM